MIHDIKIEPIGYIETPFTDKFGVPRRSGLIKNLKGVIKLTEEYSQPGVEKGLSEFSHLWVIFIFHQYQKKGTWAPVVRPPRLGGNKKMGVFASRSPQRPNFIGMSSLKLEKVERVDGQVIIHVRGIDMINGTPIIDIKPYIKDSDSLSEANRGWLENTSLDNLKLEVEIIDEIRSYIEKKVSRPQDFIDLLIEVVSQDPRPSYCRSNPREHQKNDFAFSFYDYDIGFTIKDKTKAIIDRIKPL